MFWPQIKLRCYHSCPIILTHRSLPAQMAMQSKVAAQIMKHIWIRGFFLVRTAPLFTLRTFGAQINWRVISRKVLFAPHRFLSNKSPIHFAGASGNGNTISMANLTFKMKMDIDRHGPRPMPNNCKNLNPRFFSLPTTFKVVLSSEDNTSKQKYTNEEYCKSQNARRRWGDWRQFCI